MTPDSNSQSTSGQGLSDKGRPEDLLTVFEFCRVQQLPAGRMLSGQLLPGLTPEAPAVREFLSRWPGSAGWRGGPAGWELFLFEPAPRRERWWLHAALLIVTLFSTITAGSLLAGQVPIWFQRWPIVGDWWIPIPAALDPGAFVLGLPFGLALVGILALHEAGHYFAARHHRISVTPPFFIPFPPYISVIGTLGAFIRLRSPVLDRRTLLDVGVAGPLASFLVSLPVLWWGLAHSPVVTVMRAPTAYLVRFAGERFWLGGSLAMTALSRLLVDFPEAGQVVELHPIAFAGWLGLFVTALNLLPISQLDGGHILYAMLGSRQRPLAWLFFLALIPLGFLWAGWWAWAILVFAIGRGRVQHPPLYNAEDGPGRVRVALGLAAALAFVLCFVPIPFRL